MGRDWFFSKQIFFPPGFEKLNYDVEEGLVKTKGGGKGGNLLSSPLGPPNHFIHSTC